MQSQIQIKNKLRIRREYDIIPCVLEQMSTMAKRTKKSMNSKIFAVALSLSVVALGIAGCHSSDVDYRKEPYVITVQPSEGDFTMETVLAAAVRHKCLPQVETDSEFKCTSSTRKAIVVKVKLSHANNTITIDTDEKRKIEKSITQDEYNEWVEDFEKEIKTQLAR